MVFDILALWASFRAVGSAPEVTIVWIAYIIGQLGNLIPLPGGIGGVELGLIGMLVLYGLRREADAIDLCRPGDQVEVIGLGPVTAT